MTFRQEILAAFGCGAVVGGVAGYFIAERNLKAKYIRRVARQYQIADAEIEEVKAHYRAKEMELVEQQREIANQPKPDLDKVMDELGYKTTETGYTMDERIAMIEAEEKAETANCICDPDSDGTIAKGCPVHWPIEEPSVDDAGEPVEEHSEFHELPGWNYDQQVASRTPDKPFIMHLEEYQQSECSHQITITYFEGDDVLVDESDEVISKKDETVGMDNLAKFGFGSGDPNVVYVRNPKLDIEYEILRHRGHYAKEILGLEEDPAIEHSAMPKRRPKFDDDR